MTMSMIDKTQKRTEYERKNEYPNDGIHAGRRRVQDKDDGSEDEDEETTENTRAGACNGKSIMGEAKTAVKRFLFLFLPCKNNEDPTLPRRTVPIHKVFSINIYRTKAEKRKPTKGHFRKWKGHTFGDEFVVRHKTSKKSVTIIS